MTTTVPAALATRAIMLTLLIVSTVATIGCDRSSNDIPLVKPAKPVNIMTLSQTRQLQQRMMTGSVAPWKTEQIGFEVTGRVNFVIEPNEPVQPELPSDTSPPPTPLARVDREQFEIAVATAKADVDVALRRLDVNRVSIQQRLPATLKSAEAELDLALIEYERAERLTGQNAISRSQFDNSKTRLSVARAAVEAVTAQLSQAEAEQSALQAQVGSSKSCAR